MVVEEEEEMMVAEEAVVAEVVEVEAAEAVVEEIEFYIKMIFYLQYCKCPTFLFFESSFPSTRLTQ